MAESCEQFTTVRSRTESIFQETDRFTTRTGPEPLAAQVRCCQLTSAGTEGNRTFVCDNLAFSSEIVISKRHTRFGSDRFNEGIAAAIGRLNDYRAIEAQRIATLQSQSLADNTAESIVLRA